LYKITFFVIQVKKRNKDKLGMKHIITTILILTITQCVIAQDTIKRKDSLPMFKVTNPLNGNIIISWVNKYPSIKQITIQRSTDSLKNFKSIATMPDATIPQNGFSDGKVISKIKYYYRLYIVVDNRNFFNTKSQSPVVDTSWKAKLAELKRKRFVEDSLETELKLLAKKELEIAAQKNKIVKPVKFIPQFVFNNKGGDVLLKLKDASATITYHVKFYKAEQLVLELKNLDEPQIVVDKVNFPQKGCYRYEIIQSDKILENHLICLQ
jgi:hypothetical protein